MKMQSNCVLCFINFTVWNESCWSLELLTTAVFFQYPAGYQKEKENKNEVEEVEATPSKAKRKRKSQGSGKFSLCFALFKKQTKAFISARC